jgi:hypothetical protein
MNPRHPPIATEVSNEHESYIDPYAYLGGDHVSVIEDFLLLEKNWTDAHLFKH